MITKDNLRDFLTILGFTPSDSTGEVMSFTFDNLGCTITVDIKKERIIYPNGTDAGRDTTKNFSKNENFVVLECVFGLLSQGYKPENIVLEPKTPGGREDSFFWGDILIRDNENIPYMLIECKTMDGKDDDEFSKAWKDTLRDGGQLFNYYNTYRKAQYLALYAADYVDGEPRCKYHWISMTDNKKLLETNPNLESFDEVSKGTPEDFHRVWSETYNKENYTTGAFEINIVPPFGVGKTKLTINDIQEVKEQDIYIKSKQFDQILRRYNVASHENAFDKLVNLILVKIVDEVSNPDDLQFVWKGISYDDFYSLQDRLQKLYQIGMRNYLSEEVTYIDNAEVENAFRFQKNDPDAIKDTILDFFRQLKFYSNSDFGFLDVHNKNLFIQNATILKEVVEMLQDVRLKTEAENPFLGTLFEGFLDDGVKQSEGQYFTPIPITRYMVSSLPIEVINRDSEEIPNVIDYACGAGHFLNEYASQIREYVKQYKGKEVLKDYYSHIFGIEKEYRLSKVSKVSSFMYGQDGIEIIYGDALVEHEKIKNGQFNVLIANPPYSVKGYLSTLTKEQRRNYQLSKEVDSNSIETNDNIEVFFVERAKQLLAPNGVAAIILPSSVLSDNDNLRTKTREIILKYFDIVAINEFGGSTFGKTPVTTVVLFLRRKKNNPDIAEHYKNRVESWFNGCHAQDSRFEDSYLLDKYIEYINIDKEDYYQMMAGNLTASLLENETFKSYYEIFSSDSEYNRIKRKAITVKYTEDQKVNDLNKHIIESIQNKEKEKLYYFMLCCDNPQRVLVIQPPTSVSGLKQFLGYEWKKEHNSLTVSYLNSNSANREENGIKGIITPLFDPKDLYNDTKFNSIIRNNYLGEETAIPQELEQYANYYDLKDLVDFHHFSFDKKINLAPKWTYPKIECKASIPTEKLGKIAPYVTANIKLSDIDVADFISTDNMLQNCAGVTSYEGQPNISSITAFMKGDILVSNIRPYLKKIWLADRDGGCSKDVLVFRNLEPNRISNEFLKVMLSTNEFFDYMMVGKTGIKMPRGDKKAIPGFDVPIPSVKVQQKIVEEMKAIDEKFNHNPLRKAEESKAKESIIHKYFK